MSLSLVPFTYIVPWDKTLHSACSPAWTFHNTHLWLGSKMPSCARLCCHILPGKNVKFSSLGNGADSSPLDPCQNTALWLSVGPVRVAKWHCLDACRADAPHSSVHQSIVCVDVCGFCLQQTSCLVWSVSTYSQYQYPVCQRFMTPWLDCSWVTN